MIPVKISQALSNKLYLTGLICAILVVFNHTWVMAGVGSVDWWINEIFFNNGICRIAVPFFFAMSGFLFAGRRSRWFRKKISTLLVPYEIWNVFAWLFAVLLFALTNYAGIATHTDSPPSVTSLWAWIEALGWNPFFHCGNHPLWYIRNLMILMLLAPIWDILLKKRMCCCGIIIVWLTLLTMVEGVLNLDSKWGFFFLHTFSLQSVFFLIGMYLRFYPVSVTPRCGIIALMAGVGALIFRCLSINAQMPYIAGILRWFGIIGVLVGLWSFLPSITIPLWARRLSFPIYCMHIVCLQVSAGVIGILGVREVVLSSVLFSTVRAIACIAVISVITYTSYKALPKFSDIVFGGR
jgi:fucose 4-O-acetylase-like acetyltransferase